MATTEVFNDFCKQVDTDSFAQSYTYTANISSGAFGTIMEATQISSGKPVAIKVITKGSLETEQDLLGLVTEVTVLKALKHDNILAFHKALHDEFNVYIVTEVCRGGDLIDYMEVESLKVEEVDALTLLRQVLRALVYMHAKGIAHREIKLDNVMFFWATR